MNIWDNKDLLDRLEKQRDSVRESGKRLTFDCFSLKVKGDRAHCSMGIRLGQAKDSSLDIVTVLRGICSGSCKKCAYFNTEDD